MRTPAEYDAWHIPGAVLLPYTELRQRLDEVPRDKPVYTYCRSGFRSYIAYCVLKQSGWDQVAFLAGGMMTYHGYHMTPLAVGHGGMPMLAHAEDQPGAAPRCARAHLTSHKQITATPSCRCSASHQPPGPQLLPPGRAATWDFGLWLRVSASGRVGAVSPVQEASAGGQAPSLSRRQVVPQTRQGTSEPRGSVAGDGVRRAAGQPILVGTKLHPPSVRELTIPRERLLERLRSGSDRRLTLVACPAGFGKTTLLAAWREAEVARKPVAWLTLDEGDNDPVVLWTHAIEALRRASPAVARSVPADTVVAPVVDVVLPRLVNELDGQGPITLILDDVHRLSSVPARASVRWFIDHAPPEFQLVLASRTTPALPVAALRAHGELLELRADDLRFTCAEADAFLNGRLALGLTREDVEGLVAKTEGWAAGLYLAALSLQHAADRHALVREFGGSNRHVVDFLVTEVLQAHDPAAQALMLRTSVLERLSGPLCDAVLEQDGSAAMLDALSRTNLFLVPLDDEGRWYRSTTSSPSCSGWSSSSASRGWPRRCTAAPMPGIVITARPTRRSGTP